MWPPPSRVLKYRLYEIDRIISRTLTYTIVTGLLVGLLLNEGLDRIYEQPAALAPGAAVVLADDRGWPGRCWPGRPHAGRPRVSW